jgi:hypothetical protein
MKRDSGFGSELIERSVRSDLLGDVSFDDRTTGLTLQLVASAFPRCSHSWRPSGNMASAEITLDARMGTNS